jgi:uncharacterized protein (TIGR03435 family)
MRRTSVLLPIAVLLAYAQATGWKNFSIGPPTTGATIFRPLEGLRASSMPVLRAIARAWGIDEFQVVGPEWIAQQSYSITALISGDPETFQPLFRQELASRFRIEAHREKRSTEVYVLRRGPEARHRMHQTNGDPVRGTMTAGKILIVNGTVSEMASQLSRILKRVVIDETLNAGKNFNIQLNWKANDPATIAAVLREQLGLELVEDKRAVEFLVIDRVEQLN